ncbi:MAG: guanylate kinase [Lentisphaerae bacterium]|nr:guanylate kinase [Lentisphaerota bacterium]
MLVRSGIQGAGKRRPLLLVISAPSGTGKTTLAARLLAEFKQMRRCVTCTTRPPRPGEANGRDYIFLKAAEFKRRSAAGYFLEHAKVHGHCYGTPRRSVEQALLAGHDVLLAIDVQGAAQIRKLISRAPGAMLAKAFVDVFVAPPDMAALKRRLKKRGQDDRATIRLRLKNAAREMACARAYRYLVINDRLAEALKSLRAIVRAEHCRVLKD